MTHARTISRHVRRYSLLGGVCYFVLAGLTPAHAAVNSNGIELLSASSTGVKTGQYIEAAASARYQHVNTAQRIYTRALVPVAQKTLRTGAVAALGRGFMHPGLAIAITAAGFLLDGDQPVKEVADPNDPLLHFGEGLYYDAAYSTNSGNNPNCDASNWSGTTAQSAIDSTFNTGNDLKITSIGNNDVCVIKFYSSDGSYTNFNRAYYFFDKPFNSNEVMINDGTGEPSVTNEPLVEDDWLLVDPHIPPQLFDELTNGPDLPEWRDAITVLGIPASLVVPTGDQEVAPEVATKVGQWAENIAAQLDGQPVPNPETDASGLTAEDKLVEDLNLDGDIPPFATVEPEWQVETIDAMPSWSAGIGEATCPPPTVIGLWSGLSFEVSYSPLCDFAGFIRAVVIGCAGIVALYIVLGSRS